MSLIQFLRILAARRWIMLAALLSCTIVAAVTAKILPKRYEATARVMLDTISPDPVTGISMGNQSRAFAKTQTELIMDDQVAGRVVDKLGWVTDPNIITQYDSISRNGEDALRRALSKQILDVTTARIIEPSNIIEIKYVSTSAEAAKRIADAIRQTYIDLTIELRRQGASRNADWYRDQAEKAKQLLVNAESERSKFAKENGIVLQSDNTDVESAKLNALSVESASASVSPNLPYSPSAQVSGAASLQLEALNQQIAQAGQTLGPNHPAYQALLRQRTVMELAVSRERSVPVGTAPSSAAFAQRAQSAYEAQRSRVVGQRDKVDQLNQLTRDIDVKRDQFLKAAQRAADLRLESTTAESGVTILGEATVPDTPSYPKIPLIMFGAIAFGSALGVCLALLIELFGRRVRSDEDLLYAAKAPVYAIIGQAENSDTWYRRFARWVQARSAARRSAQFSEA